MIMRSHRSEVTLWVISVIYLSLAIDLTEAKKGGGNIVLHGGGGGKHGCCHGGGGALIMEHGKGKKHEKLIIKDDNLIMQGGNSDGDLIMDGSNLIMKEGKKKGNLIIKGGGGGGHCDHHEHHKEEHVAHPMPIHIKHHHSKERRIYVPVPVHHKKKVVHHHHTKEEHHHEHEGGYHRNDVSESSTKFLRKKGLLSTGKPLKLNVGEKLSEDHKAKLKRNDRSRKRLSGLANGVLRRLSRLTGSSATTNQDDTAGADQFGTGVDGSSSSANEENEPEANSSNEISPESSSSNDDEPDSNDDFFSMLAPFSAFGYGGAMSPFGLPFEPPKYTNKEKAFNSLDDLHNHHHHHRNDKLTDKETISSNSRFENREQISEAKSITTTPTSISTLPSSIKRVEPTTSASIVQPVFTPDDRYVTMRSVNLINTAPSPHHSINYQPILAGSQLIANTHIPFTGIAPTPIPLSFHHQLIGTPTAPAFLHPSPNPLDHMTGMLLQATQVQNRMLQEQLLQNHQLMQQQQLLIQKANATQTEVNPKVNSKNHDHSSTTTRRPHSPRSTPSSSSESDDDDEQNDRHSYPSRGNHRTRSRHYSSSVRPSYSSRPHRPYSTYKSYSGHYEPSSASSANNFDDYTATEQPPPQSSTPTDYWDKVIATTPDFVDTLLPSNFDTIDQDAMRDIMSNTLLLKRRSDSQRAFRSKAKNKFKAQNELFFSSFESRPSRTYSDHSADSKFNSNQRLQKSKFVDFLDDFDRPSTSRSLFKPSFDSNEFEQVAGSDTHSTKVLANPIAFDQSIDFEAALSPKIRVNHVRLNNNAMIKSYHATGRS